MRRKYATLNTKDNYWASYGPLASGDITFQSPHSVVVRTDHSTLRYFSSQAAMNTIVWKWLAIMQGYDLDIQHHTG